MIALSGGPWVLQYDGSWITGRHPMRGEVVLVKALAATDDDMRLMASAREMVDVLRRLAAAAQSRDATVGDPMRLIEVREELRASACAAHDLLHRLSRGES